MSLKLRQWVVATTALLLVVLLGACAPERYEPGLEAPAAATSPLRARLLSAQQYRNTIASVFGEDIAQGVLPPIPPMSRTQGLRANGAAAVGLTSDQLSQIHRAAVNVAARVTDAAHRDFLLPCPPAAGDMPAPECVRDFLREAGGLLQRRPLSEAQLEVLFALAERAGASGEDAYKGIALALEAMLISPEFLFIVDRAEPDPEQPQQQRLDAFSLASRLSYFLWNGPPDAVLLEAAARGELYNPDGLEQTVERMLQSERLEQGVRAFFDDMLAFDAFDSLAKDAAVYPMVTGTTLAHAREQTLRTVVDHLIHREADYRDLFTTPHTFMSPPLAVVYQTPTVPGWVPWTFEEGSSRAGLLTHLSFLAVNSHSVRSSPTLRGKALREELLCQVVPPPPPDVDFSALEENEHAKTARERLDAHNSNPACAGCHLITDPMGLALEQFDGAGRFRSTENGAELDIRGELDGMMFDDVPGLAQALRDHPALPACLVGRLYAYGTGGPNTPTADRPTLAWLEQRFAAQGYALPALLRDIALSPAFRQPRLSTPEAMVAAVDAATAPARISLDTLALQAPATALPTEQLPNEKLPAAQRSTEPLPPGQPPTGQP